MAVRDAKNDDQKNLNVLRKEPEGRQPWGIFAKIKPDQHGNYKPSDLPAETFEPPPTPKGKLRSQINKLTVDFQHAIKHKLINKLRNLLKKAYDIAPSELENMICHAELIIKQNQEKQALLENELGPDGGDEAEAQGEEPYDAFKDMKKDGKKEEEGHSHGQGHSHGHSHGKDGHSHGHDHGKKGDGHGHSHGGGGHGNSHAKAPAAKKPAAPKKKLSKTK